jgi:signal transduction histidine kinase
VGAAFSIEGMVEQIAQSALTATNADGAIVQRIDVDRGEVTIAAVAGHHALTLGEWVPYAGSLAERVIERGEPELIPRLAEAGGEFSSARLRGCADCAALTVPLRDSSAPIGILILLREPGKRPFREDEVGRAGMFADLATSAFRKMHLLKEAERRGDELARVMESRARLVRGFSHDVKNPLGAADGYLQLLEEGIPVALSEKQNESVGRARRSIASALKLIEDLTELARAEAGKIVVQREPVDVCRIARDMVEEHRARARAEGLALTVDVPDSLPAIESDASRVRQILGNLLSNAIKYATKGDITVHVAPREHDGAPRRGRWLALDVIDTGPGIDPDQQKYLFQEFRRLGTAGATSGAGIGLAISHRLAHALGGDLTVVSAVGRGSTFTLWLPAGPVAAAPAGDAQPGG